MYKSVRVRLADFISICQISHEISICQISHENVTKLFHFHRIFLKKWAALRGFERTPSGSATES